MKQTLLALRATVGQWGADGMWVTIPKSNGGSTEPHTCSPVPLGSPFLNQKAFASPASSHFLWLKVKQGAKKPNIRLSSSGEAHVSSPCTQGSHSAQPGSWGLL